MQIEEQNVQLPVFHTIIKNEELKTKEKLCANVQKAIKNIIKREAFFEHQVNVKALIPDGGNYLANLYEINITGKNGTEKREINLFVKQAVADDNLHGFIDIEDAYLKEVFFYTELCVIFDSFQQKAGISPNFRFKHVNCYSESGVQAIIMENLTKKGYKVLSRLDIMSLKFAELSVQQIAKFHALTFVLQKNMPEYFETKVKNVKTVLKVNEKYKEIVTKCVTAAVEHFDEKIRNEFMNDLPDLINTITKYITDTASSVNCLCHGDFRLNNILVKQEGEDVVDIIPIDYQLLFYGPPVIDLIYLFHCSSDAKFRLRYERYLKDLYRDTMQEFLRKFDINMETVYPKEVFEHDYDTMSEYGFLVSLCFVPVCYADESDFLEPGCDLIKKEFKLDKKFPERISGIYEEYQQFKNRRSKKSL